MKIEEEYVAKEAGYVLNFKKVTEREMLKASIKDAKGNLFYIEELFKKAL